MINEKDEEMRYALNLSLCRLVSVQTSQKFSIQAEAGMNGNYYIMLDDRPVFFGDIHQIESVLVLLLDMLISKE